MYSVFTIYLLPCIRPKLRVTKITIKMASISTPIEFHWGTVGLQSVFCRAIEYPKLKKINRPKTY